MANPLNNLTNPNVITTDGSTVDATSWTTDWSSVVNYINANLTASFNVFSAKGDMMCYDGSNIQALAVGTNGQFLQSNSSAPFGLQWATAATLTTLTTNGDMVYYNTGANQRLPIGMSGQVLSVSSGGLPQWSNGGLAPGIIAIWSGSVVSIPSGWVLCNGNNSTPNLQGLFVVGAGNSSPAATNGMGLISPNTQAGDTSSGAGVGAAYSPTVMGSVSGVTSGNSSNVNTPETGVPGAAANGHTHSFSATLTTTTNSFTVTPCYYALCYIMYVGS